MRVADLFCGCGGLTSGFEAAGHEIVFAADTWSSARLVYDANFDHASQKFDLSDVIDAAFAVSRASPEIVVGGPPCQDFSAAGSRAEGDRADLTVSFADIVRACQPVWFVMENVPAATTSQAWATARRRLSTAGYGLSQLTLDASLYGVPQLRKRTFLIGRLNQDDDFINEDILNEEAERPLTVREYLGGEFGVEYYYRHPRNWGRRAIYSIDEPAATVRSTNRPIPPKYTHHALDAAPIEGVKPLSCFQRARLQTFLPDFAFDHSLAPVEIDLMVANAVPVRMAQNLATCIAAFEEGNDLTVERAFRAWLRDTQSFTLRSVGNVVSGLRRVRRMIGTETRFHDMRDAVHALERASEFAGLSTSVRSQLRRAIVLHSEFSSSRS
jgi:DNA (cytosine-5)-methyltransferase 1